MRGLVAIIVAGALGVAALTFFVVPRLLRAPEAVAAVPKEAPAFRVLVAATNLPAGTIIKPDQVRWQAWPEQGVDASFILEGRGIDPAQTVVTSAVKRGFTAGEPIALSRLAQRGEAGFLAAALSPGMRAVSVKIDAVSGIGGFILPGDRVDVMLAAQYELEKTSGKSEMRSFAEMMLSDIRVLAIDQSMKDVPGPDDKQQAKVAATATLEVNIRQAEVIGVANQMGKLTLVLTGLVRPEDEETTLADAPRFLDDVAVSRFWRAMKSRPEVADPDVRPPKPAMVVYRGTEGSIIGGKAP
jgi:pilus assembly protein CpaB